MYTQVTYHDLVDGILSRIGQDYDIPFERPSPAIMHRYETGKWLYDIDGISVRVFRWGMGDPWDREGVPGYHWNDERHAFEQRLEADLRSRVQELMNPRALARGRVNAKVVKLDHVCSQQRTR